MAATPARSKSPHISFPSATGIDIETGQRVKYRPSRRALFAPKRSRILLVILFIFIFVKLAIFSGSLLSFPDGLSAGTCGGGGDEDAVDWSRYAYAQYTTDQAYLCNSVMIFESLRRLGSKADRILMYPEEWTAKGSWFGLEPELLAKARDDYGVKLRPVRVLQVTGDPTWGESFTKLLAFNQTDYQRILSVDSDGTILQSMDELFLLPETPVAMPRAYWMEQKNILSSQIMLLQPSRFEFQRIQDAVLHKKRKEFDMEIMNNLYNNSAMILPHRQYDLLSGEFRNTNHEAFLGSTEEVWDPEKALREAKFVHFSDWPYPKPWILPSEEKTLARRPNCTAVPTGSKKDCRAQEIWLRLYSDFRKRRENICGSGYLKPDLEDEENKMSDLKMKTWRVPGR